MVACHLLKWVHYKQDTEGENIELRFFKDREDREVDFIITQNEKPIYAIEVKLGEEPISKHLLYFKKKIHDVSAFQIYLNGKKDYISAEGIRCMSALNFLKDFI